MRHTLGLASALLVWSFGLPAAPAMAQSAAPPAAEAAGPVAATLPPAGEGRRLFLKLNCYGCHGMHAQGGMAPAVAGEQVGEVIHTGEDTGMPSFKRWATTTNIADINAYLNSIGTKNEPIFTHWWEPFPTQ